MTTRVVRPTHVFLPDSVADWRGFPWCAACGLPRGNRVHEVPAVDEDARQVEARRLGEGD